ncbi:MAG: septum formation initiator family protein [Candidatus Daviesbacteria bacterium]|nr:septum formation initiator family protein [Candidatus Daviesbacteria bacterium]
MLTRLTKLIVVTTGIFLIISLVRSIVDIWQKGSLLDREEEKYAQVKLEYEELNAEYEMLESPDYIERTARDKLGLSKEGEMVVVLPPVISISPSEATITDIPKPEKREEVWQLWANWFLNK